MQNLLKNKQLSEIEYFYLFMLYYEIMNNKSFTKRYNGRKTTNFNKMKTVFLITLLQIIFCISLTNVLIL